MPIVVLLFWKHSGAYCECLCVSECDCTIWGLGGLITWICNVLVLQGLRLQRSSACICAFMYEVILCFVLVCVLHTWFAMYMGVWGWLLGWWLLGGNGGYNCGPWGGFNGNPTYYTPMLSSNRKPIHMCINEFQIPYNLEPFQFILHIWVPYISFMIDLHPSVWECVALANSCLMSKDIGLNLYSKLGVLKFWIPLCICYIWGDVSESVSWTCAQTWLDQR